MEKIGLCGHGNMGSGIALNLLKAGHQVLIFTIREPEQVKVNEHLQNLQVQGAIVTDHLDDIFSKTEILVTCLPNAEIIEQVLIGDNGLLQHSRPSVELVIDFSTTKPESTRKIAGLLKEKGIDMLDTPMSGGPRQAAEGTIKLAVGGERAVYEACKDLLSQVAAETVYIGLSGAGHAMKLINNFMGILNQCTTSAVCILCEQLSIDKEALYQFISMSGGNSWGFQNQFSTIKTNKFPLNFSLDFASKDLNYAKSLFASAQVPFEVVDDLAALFRQAQEKGFGSQDVGTIYKYLQQRQKET